MRLNFDFLVEKAKEDLELNQDNLIEASSKTGIDMVFYAEQRHYWMTAKNDATAKLERLARYLWLYYSGKATAKHLEILSRKTPFKLQLNNKQDIESFITSDQLYQEQQAQVNEAESVIKFLDEVIGAVRFRAQVVRNIIQEKNSLGGN